MYVRIEYVNVIEGGSGSTNIELEDLPLWLAKLPGTLVKYIEPMDSIIDIHDTWQARKAALRDMGSRY